MVERVASSARDPVAISIEGESLAREIAALGVSHVITVPDTNLKTTIAALERLDRPKVLYVCTEDEAIGINAGLYIAGHTPMLLIQNNGLYACMNTIRAIALDAAVPTLMLIGQFLRDVTKPVEENAARSVRLLEPALRALNVPTFRLENPNELQNLRRAFECAHRDRGPSAALVGAPTT